MFEFNDVVARFCEFRAIVVIVVPAIEPPSGSFFSFEEVIFHCSISPFFYFLDSFELGPSDFPNDVSLSPLCWHGNGPDTGMVVAFDLPTELIIF